MKWLNLNYNTDDMPLYLAIAKAVRGAIQEGQLQAGDALPSSRHLAEQCGCNRHTVMNAYQELVAEGWIESRQRSGYRVVEELPVESSLGTGAAKDSPEAFSWRIPRQTQSLPFRKAVTYSVNFAGGCPDISLFPFQTFRGYMNEAMLRPDIQSLNYGDNAGYLPFIEQVDIFLRRRRSVVDKKIVIVNGTQEALYILAQLLLQPGDHVAVEALGYAPAWNAFRNAGASLVGIEQDHLGIVPEHLEKVAQQKTLRALYLTPLHQYPTTVSLSASRRLKILDIAQRYHIPIIEDDYDHEFHYRCQPIAPMAAKDPAQQIIYLSSFSKLMFPAARIGFLALPPALYDSVVQYRSVMNHKANVPMQDAVARWMKSGDFERYLRKLTRTYERRRDLMVSLLTQYQQKGIDLSFEKPDGGMALWVKTSGPIDQVFELSEKQGVFFQHERHFHLDSRSDQNRYMRLGFAGVNEDKMMQGLSCIMEHLKPV
ncbi:PLP-dependent aminotransferase family protein [Pleionea sp. CnH1-48]|uniref:MocR-like pyridoxine biosynthesis transcription factor PdxR n=1 Tax=Pleionea sp. CnH1-48 TaxID=2954494 RepID=UPI0020969012|nr:PLP-dependent aminotransferase family protein [Pleionea sp. CnH1-48]MCO7226199.1 PLP-dependent aminotransferase family protein [Pleionea sp. CnH1-48]